MLKHFTFSPKQRGEKSQLFLGLELFLLTFNHSPILVENNKGKRKRNYINFPVVCGFQFLYFYQFLFLIVK